MMEGRQRLAVTDNFLKIRIGFRWMGGEVIATPHPLPRKIISPDAGGNIDDPAEPGGKGWSTVYINMNLMASQLRLSG
jgi:hypothetical protein